MKSNAETPRKNIELTSVTDQLGTLMDHIKFRTRALTVVDLTAATALSTKESNAKSKNLPSLGACLPTTLSLSMIHCLDAHRVGGDGWLQFM